MTSDADPLQSTLDALTHPPRADGQAKIIAVTSAFSQSGSSHVARELALLAASYYGPAGGRAGLIDLDINNQTQADFFDTPSQISQYGALAGPYDATFGQSPFWQVSPDMVDAYGARNTASTYCGMYMLGDTGLVLTRFDWTSVKSGQSVHVVNSPDYWQAARQNFSFVVVDCPAFDRTDIAVNVIPIADMTLLVSAPHRAADPAHNELSLKVSQAGGRCAGLVLNAGAKADSFSGYAAP